MLKRVLILCAFAVLGVFGASTAWADQQSGHGGSKLEVAAVAVPRQPPRQVQQFPQAPQDNFGSSWKALATDSYGHLGRGYGRTVSEAEDNARRACDPSASNASSSDCYQHTSVFSYWYLVAIHCVNQRTANEYYSTGSSPQSRASAFSKAVSNANDNSSGSYSERDCTVMQWL